MTPITLGLRETPSSRRAPAWIVVGAAFSIFSACAAPPPEPAVDLPFSASLLDRLDAAPTASDGATTTPVRATGASTPSASSYTTSAHARVLPAVFLKDAYRGLVGVSLERLAVIERAAGDPTALAELLLAKLPPDELAALAVLRSPVVRKAWDQYEAARTSYQQSKDLEDLVGIYRSFTVDTMTRVGPERSKTPTAAIAPSPNVSELSAEVAKRATEIAFQKVRSSVRDIVARAWTVHSDAVRLAEARRILRDEVELDRALLDIQRSHLESGSGSQAGFLAFESRLARLETDLSILNERTTLVRAQWNTLLSRAEDAPVDLDVETGLPEWTPKGDGERAVFLAADAARPELLSARLGAERAEIALRLAETMTLPRFDVGTSRFTPVKGFTEPGFTMPPRADFGVREAQVQEMRARAESAKAAEIALLDRVRVETRSALFDVDAAQQMLDIHDQTLVPLARDSLDAARGAYEGNRATYLDLLDGVQRLLDARLGLADARRDLGHAFADVIRAIGVTPWNAPAQ